MRTRDDIWLPEQDKPRRDRLAWEDEREDSPEADDQEGAPEDRGC